MTEINNVNNLQNKNFDLKLPISEKPKEKEENSIFDVDDFTDDLQNGFRIKVDGHIIRTKNDPELDTTQEDRDFSQKYEDQIDTNRYLQVNDLESNIKILNYLNSVDNDNSEDQHLMQGFEPVETQDENGNKAEYYVRENKDGTTEYLRVVIDQYTGEYKVLHSTIDAEGKGNTEVWDVDNQKETKESSFPSSALLRENA